MKCGTLRVTVVNVSVAAILLSTLSTSKLMMLVAIVAVAIVCSSTHSGVGDGKVNIVLSKLSSAKKSSHAGVASKVKLA